MGLTSSFPGRTRRRNVGNQGNLLVDGFVHYAQSDRDWAKVKSVSSSKVHMEVLMGDLPLGTWRGHTMIEGATLEDVQSYISFKLGADQYELLAVTEEDEFVFRDVFDFGNLPPDVKAARQSFYSSPSTTLAQAAASTLGVTATAAVPTSSSSSSPDQQSGGGLPRRIVSTTHAGDHRGEDSELFESKARKVSARRAHQQQNGEHDRRGSAEPKLSGLDDLDDFDDEDDDDDVAVLVGGGGGALQTGGGVVVDLDDALDNSASRSDSNLMMPSSSSSSLLPPNTPTSASTTMWWGIQFPASNAPGSSTPTAAKRGSNMNPPPGTPRMSAAAGNRLSTNNNNRLSHKKGSKLNIFSLPSASSSPAAAASAPVLPTVRDAPLPRELIFKRQEFLLDNGSGGNNVGERTIVTIAQSCKGYGNLTSSSYESTRGLIKMLGTMVEEFPSPHKYKTAAYTGKTKLTFVCSLDPLLSAWEVDLATANALSHFGGKQRVERFLSDAQDFFKSKRNRLILSFRQLAGASVGELGWKEVERSRNELQLGTNVVHAKHGHGIVQSFDMKGRVRVAYDSKQIVDHLPEEKDELKVSVLIGTRVKHKEKGFGTVKAFDEGGRVHVKFDNGEFHRYKQAAWKRKFKLTGIGGALGTVKLSWRPFEDVREGMGRVKFAVGVPTTAVLQHILQSSSVSSADDLKGGSILERRIVERVSDHECVVYENRRMPPPLTNRDFVFRLIWDEVAPKTYVVVMESVVRVDIPEQVKTVRGETHLSGWLLEPLYLDRVAADGSDHISRLTYQLCIDTKGFVAPDSVEAVRQALLLAAVADTRAQFAGHGKPQHVVTKQQDNLDKMLSKKDRAGPKVVKPNASAATARGSLDGLVDIAAGMNNGSDLNNPGGTSGRNLNTRSARPSVSGLMRHGSDLLHKLSDLGGGGGGGSSRKLSNNGGGTSSRKLSGSAVDDQVAYRVGGGGGGGSTRHSSMLGGSQSNGGGSDMKLAAYMEEED